MTRNEGARALEALTDSRRSGTPWVTYGFVTLCYLVTVPALLHPPVGTLLGGLEPRRHAWQPFTAVLVHGWPGFPGVIHLGLNTILMLWCGRPCERLLGAERFATLVLLSVAANGAAQLLLGGVNGSSLVIWAWGPPVLVAMLRARHVDPQVVRSPAWARLRDVLALMYGVIVIAMGALPYLAGWRGNPLMALLMGNQFHLVATGVGAIGAWLWRDRIRARIAVLGRAEQR